MVFPGVEAVDVGFGAEVLVDMVVCFGVVEPASQSFLQFVQIRSLLVRYSHVQHDPLVSSHCSPS